MSGGEILVFKEHVIGVGCVGWIEKRSSAQREGDWSQGTGQAGVDEGGVGWGGVGPGQSNYNRTSTGLCL